MHIQRKTSDIFQYFIMSTQAHKAKLRVNILVFPPVKLCKVRQTGHGNKFYKWILVHESSYIYFWTAENVMKIWLIIAVTCMHTTWAVVKLTPQKIQAWTRVCNIHVHFCTLRRWRRQANVHVWSSFFQGNLQYLTSFVLHG